MVAMSCLEVLRKGSLQKENARQDVLIFFAELCNSLHDGRLPSTSGTGGPHVDSVSVDLHDPVHDLLQVQDLEHVENDYPFAV